MSATNRGGKRRAGDYYATPIDVVRQIVQSIDMPSPARVLEPSCGDGRFVFAAGDRWPLADYVGLEPGPHRPPWAEQVPLEHYFSPQPFDLILGNPPFTPALEHMRICLGLLAPRGQLVFLLRLAILESAKRREFWAEHPAKRVQVLPDRPSFCWAYRCKSCGLDWTTEPGVIDRECGACYRTALSVTKTDACAYGIFTWQEGYDGPTVLEHL